MDYFVLMADIINSGKKDGLKLMNDFKNVVKEINKEYKSVILSPFTITLGDEFQGIVANLTDSIKIIFKIEELFIHSNLNFKLRYVLNYGKIETKINSKIAYEMLGPALTEARSLIIELKKKEERFLINTNTEKDTYINQALIVLQNIIDCWKEKDLKTVSAFLKTNDYKKVALLVKKIPSSTWRRQKSLKIKEYGAIKQVILYMINK